MVRLLAPILAFTAEEIWTAMPHGKDADTGSVLYNDIPSVWDDYTFTPEQERKWSNLLALRNDVNKALELARAQKIVGKPLDAAVTLYISQTAKAPFAEIAGEDLEQLFIVSQVTVVDGEGAGYPSAEFPGVTVAVEASQAPKCVRCWCHDEHVGQDAEHPELCPRCAQAVRE